MHLFWDSYFFLSNVPLEMKKSWYVYFRRKLNVYKIVFDVLICNGYYIYIYIYIMLGHHLDMYGHHAFINKLKERQW